MTPHPMPWTPCPPTSRRKDLALLYCPEQGGWHTAGLFERRWVDFATMTLELEPTHWLPIPRDPKDVTDERSPAHRALTT